MKLRNFICLGACVKYKSGEIIDESNFKVEFKKHNCDYKTSYVIIILNKFFIPYWFTKKETKYSLKAIKNEKN